MRTRKNRVNARFPAYCVMFWEVYMVGDGLRAQERVRTAKLALSAAKG
jgi:hypothetical protein